MKLATVVLTSLALIETMTCTPCFGEVLPKEEHSRVSTSPTRVETVAYFWEVQRVNVSFFRRQPDSCWVMSVRDSTEAMEKSLVGEEVAWEPRCSLADLLILMKRSLVDFRTLKPEAKLESVHLEMQVMKELWNEILPQVKKVLADLDGYKQATRLDTPDEVNSAVRRIVATSTTAEAVRKFLNESGIAAGAASQCNEILFKDSVAGRQWRAISKMPGAGIMVPGAVEFVVPPLNNGHD